MGGMCGKHELHPFSSKKAWNVLRTLAEDETNVQNNSSNIRADHKADKLVENCKGSIYKQGKAGFKKQLRNFMKTKTTINEIAKLSNFQFQLKVWMRRDFARA